MTPRERYRAMLNFDRPDRPFIGQFDIRRATMEAWWQQGHPRDVSTAQLLGLDEYLVIPLNASHCPKFEKQIVEERDGHITYYDEEGALRTESASATGSGFVTRSWLRFPVENRQDFRKMRERYVAEDTARRDPGFDAAIANSHFSTNPTLVVIFGFYWTMRQWLGFEGLSVAFHDMPGLILEMMDFILQFNIGLVRSHLAESAIDNFMISEDMAYKTACMVSPRFVRDEFVPRYRELVQEARLACADKVFIDSDGHISELIPLWVEAGIDGTSPVEIASEQDILDYAERYPRFLFLGGIDKRRLSRSLKDVEAEILPKAEKLYARGGWVPNVDHAVPADIPFGNFRYAIELLKKAW